MVNANSFGLGTVAHRLAFFSHNANHANSFIYSNSEAKGLLIQIGSNGVDGPTKDPEEEEPSSDVDGSDDMEKVKKNPLIRAQACLETSFHLLQQEKDSAPDIHALTSTELALSYVSLELRDYSRALKMAKLVIDGDAPKAEPSSPNNKSETSTENRGELRKIATARMYASEASCALGDAPAGMRFLVGDGQDDAFDRLASELGGVTMKTAATNIKGKTRLARAQSMVRSSASAASAVLGNIGPAKQLAMSAQAMEDAYSSSREGSTARRALVYCMLREGNNGAALSLLKSLT